MQTNSLANDPNPYLREIAFQVNDRRRRLYTGLVGHFTVDYCRLDEQENFFPRYHPQNRRPYLLVTGAVDDIQPRDRLALWCMMQGVQFQRRPMLDSTLDHGLLIYGPPRNYFFPDAEHEKHLTGYYARFGVIDTIRRTVDTALCLGLSDFWNNRPNVVWLGDAAWQDFGHKLNRRLIAESYMTIYPLGQPFPWERDPDDAVQFEGRWICRANRLGNGIAVEYDPEFVPDWERRRREKAAHVEAEQFIPDHGGRLKLDAAARRRMENPIQFLSTGEARVGEPFNIVFADEPAGTPWTARMEAARQAADDPATRSRILETFRSIVDRWGLTPRPRPHTVQPCLPPQPTP